MMFKWFKKQQEQKEEELALLREINLSLRKLSNTIEINVRYGNAIKTTPAKRY